MNPNNRRGVTLLEVTVACVLVASITLVLYQTLIFSDAFERRETRLRQDQVILHSALGRLAQDVQESQSDFIRVATIQARVPAPPGPVPPPQTLVVIPSARRVIRRCHTSSHQGSPCRT